ncbi:MAG TPA: hypothetical protein VEX60_09185 [Pyrinomonadaceae bacterium]|nr:hypothetical protein [Pyrinomonadaceae bacterium]
MKTFKQFEQHIETVPLTTSWHLADLGEARGRQELFTKQSPQKLKVLREHAIIESAVSSNRIEGIQIDQARIGTVVFGKSNLRDRDEEEVRGYRDALKLIHEQGAKLRLTDVATGKDRSTQVLLTRVLTRNFSRSLLNLHPPDSISSQTWATSC